MIAGGDAEHPQVVEADAEQDVDPGDLAVAMAKPAPMMPTAWTKTYGMLV